MAITAEQQNSRLEGPKPPKRKNRIAGTTRA